MDSVKLKLTDDADDENAVPRSRWLAKVMRQHPDVLELKERVRPINHSLSFARSKAVSKTEVREVLSDDVVSYLLMQFLSEEQLDLTLQTMEKETKTKYAPDEVPEKALGTLLSMGIPDLKNLFRAPADNPNEDEEVESFRTYVRDTGSEDDIVIWSESPLDPDKVVLTTTTTTTTAPNGSPAPSSQQTHQLVAGTFNQLVLWLTDKDRHDLDFRKAFFLTYQSFTTPERLLAKIIQRYHVPPDKTGALDPSLAILNLKFWMDTYPHDFHELLVVSMQNFIDNTLVRDGHTQWAKQLRGSLAAAQVSGPVDLRLDKEPPEPKVVPGKIFSPTLTLDDIDEEEIARQMCLIDFDTYSKITPSEFLQKAWSRNKSRSPNVLATVRRFNDVAKWVASTILSERKASSLQRSSSSTKQHSRALPRFLKIAEHLRNMNNYLSTMAIYAGISNTAVHHLKGLTANLSKPSLDMLHELESLYSCAGSFRQYRQEYHNTKPPCVPFIGVHLRDVSFIEDCMTDHVGPNNDLINFAKCQRLWQSISLVLQFQPIPYNFHRVHQIMVFLVDLKSLTSSDNIYELADAANKEE